jgi:hypothetical protein
MLKRALQVGHAVNRLVYINPTYARIRLNAAQSTQTANASPRQHCVAIALAHVLALRWWVVACATMLPCVAAACPRIAVIIAISYNKSCSHGAQTNPTSTPLATTQRTPCMVTRVIKIGALATHKEILLLLQDDVPPL